MKTNSLMLGAAVLMLATACSNDEVVKVAENSAAIGFSSFVNNSTRYGSGEGDPANMQVYAVSSRVADDVAAFKVFYDNNDENVVTISGGIGSYSPTRYWVSGNAYTFAAVAPANVATVAQGLGDTNGGITTITFANSGNVDLLYDTQDVEKAETTMEAVKFNLGHLLSRVKFQFEDAMTDGYSIVVKNVKINNVIDNAVYTVVPEEEGGATGWSSTSKDGSFTFNMGAFNDKKVAESVPQYIVPETAGYNATFDIDLLFNGAKFETYAHSVTLPETAFTSGYSYLFKATVTKDNVSQDDKLNPIEFEATVANWEDAADQDLPMK